MASVLQTLIRKPALDLDFGDRGNRGRRRRNIRWARKSLGRLAGVLLLACVAPGLVFLKFQPQWEKAIQGLIIFWQ